MIVVKGEEVPESGNNDELQLGSPQSCTGNLPYIGLRLCSSSYFSILPKGTDMVEENEKEGDMKGDTFVPYFPLNGPSHLSLSLDKANPSLFKTRFHYGWNNNQVCPSF